MANFFLASVLFRIALPLLILTCALFRPCLLSAIYLFLLLYSSLVPVPTEKSMAGPTGIYFKILMAFSILGFILQLAFQIVLFAIPPYGHFLVHCEMLEMVLSYCGFVRLDDANGIVMTTWLSPEIVMVLSSLVIYLFCKKLTSSSLDEEANENPPELPQKTKSKRNFGFWISLGKYTCVISLCVTAVLRPSAVGAFYFLVFIGSCTWWACCKELERAFGIVCRIVMAFVFLHIVCLYAYQFEWIRQKVDNEVPYSGLLGIEQLFNVSCSDPRDIQWTQIHWDAYLHPLALIWLFYIMAIVSKHLLKPKEYHHSHTSSVVSEHTPLMRGVSPSRRYGSGTRKGHLSVLQDSTGSVTVTSENPDDIPLRELAVTEEEDGADCFENAVFIVESIITFIIQSSYVVTNIIMMTWSITYHSWLTFVLLLWAMILWMIPNQRRSTLRCSPFLVFYAIFLLLSAYVYCMDIPDLPDHIYGISLEQIGINKIEDYPCNSLMIKSLFTLMFWITLRQHVKEIKEARQANTLAEMAAPLQVTVTTTTATAKDAVPESNGFASGITREQEQETQILKTIGEHTKKFLSRMWIWIVAITLFAVAITGDRMTAFRIMYMALFLFFIITFQLSFRIWLKVMFAFWLTVIIYSMIILILVYTYQFDSFDDYWTKYLHVPKEQQLDIGLERYGPTQLFVRLATPTFFVIVTVIQLHYFHDDFIKLSRAAEQPIVAPTSEEGSSLQGKVLEQRDDDTDKSNLSSLKIDLTDLGNVSSIHIKYKLNAMAAKMGKLVNFAFLFLEIYMHKFVLLIAMLMCIYDSCALYYAVLFFVVIAVTTSTRTMQLFVIYSSSIFVSFILLTRMVYQIQYIKHDTWNVSCNISENVSLNNADWLGFRKTVRGRHLPYLVRWNIAYILAVTLYTVVIIRQFNHKLLRHKPTTRWFFMFPGINRAEADKNLCNCLKYLANYGYYKFGVEISLMATVALIGFRMDLYAILYSVWLCILFPMKRGLLSKIWNVYLIFIAVFIPIQYVMVVGLPPILCLDFKWDEGGPNSTLRPLQEWAFLMDYLYPPAAKKLVFDCILLLFVSRQAVVFRIERRYKNRDYPGGSNDSIIHFAEHKDFVNPSPDFITYTRSYLDVVKRVVLLGFMWLTLAIVFLAGANRVNMFSIGYLLGSFIFLWQGSDIYLRPIPKILKSWNCLLGYNILVILTKTILQLVGCVFLGDISECWLVQLLGIGCVRKFTAIPKNLPGDMCEVPRDYIGLVWDGICFGFLIMQRRIFCSYNFFHMIDETKATTILASRGAELIEQLRQKRMHEQDEQERRILEKIKAKMDRIKATQKKMQGPFQSTTNHYVDEIYPKSSRPLYKRRQPKTYKEAIRSGDYYMFDELEDDDDLDMIEELKPEEDEESDEEKRGGGRRRTLAELLSTAIRTDIGTTIRTTKDGTSSRRASMPLARQKSTMSTRSQISAPLSAPPIIEESPERRRTPSAQKKRARLADIEPQPSTSKDEDMSEYSEPKASKCQAFMDVVLFVWAFLDSLMVSLINFLNSYSRDYRYVVKVLKKERKLLKQTSEYTQGIRTGRSQMWQPAGSYHSLLHRSQAIEQARDNSADNSNNTATAVSGDSDEKQPPSECSEGKGPTSPLPYSPEKDRRKASVLTVPEIRILAPSMERGLDSPSLLPCSSDVLTTIHPKFEEYDTGELSSYDQPTVIRFGLALWYIVVSHSDILCYFVLFLNQIKSATFLSLPLPLMVFLWGTLTVPRPSKNFWITIIAYTQMIVLIKCLFQFEFLPWNRDMYYNYNPMNPAKIFGVERKSNYAIWDLLLLLIVFFHRYLLKCLGLWKTTVMVTPIFKDGEYMVDEEDIQPLKRAGMGAARLGLLEYEATKETVREPKFYVRKGQASMLLPKKKKVHLSPNPIESDENVRKRHVPKDKKEDLQRLVEENEDTPEEEDAETYSGIDNVVSVNVKQTTPYEMFPDTLQMSTSKYMEAIKDFFIQLRDPTSRVAVDVYSYMFLCDFFNFFVILIGFSSFGTQQGDGGVSSYLEDNRVPTLFLLMLILQFTLIIVDRAIFLRKNILAKIVFQFVQIIVLHVWLFVLFPVMTERRFNSVIPPQMYYMVKCFYLLLSAYQIRCGYPSRILGNFLCKGYNYFNMFLFKGFMVIPFLFELRSVMDWVWTDTSMTIFDWIKMEDIFAHIFQLKEFQPPEFLQKITGKQSDKKKCTRHVESEFPQPRGERKTPAAKYFMGGLILFIIVAIIWFPLVFFSLGNAVGEPNPPYDVSLEVRIGPYEPVYHISAQSNAIDQFSKGDLTELITTYKNNKGASAFIARYEAPDIVAIRLSADSANIWGVSPPDRRRMINEINSTNPISIRLLYVVSHHSNNKDVGGVIREENVIIMEAQVNGQPNNERQKLLEMLTDNTSVPAINLGYILPKFLKVTNRGTARPVPQMMNIIDNDPRTEELRQLTLLLRKSTKNTEIEWWEVNENCSDANYMELLKALPYHDCDSIVIYAFNDRLFPETLSFITAGGIIGLYTTLVFVASRVLRGFFSEICFKIMFDDMPNVDRVLQLCLDIYLVREAREFWLEEDLFAKLVFLFRSPETLIKWTRPKEELADDEDPEGEPE